MDLSRYQLKVFVRLVESGSMRLTAERLSTSVSKVSRVISGLEEKLGLALFIRQNGKIQLTREGASFYDRALKVLASFDELLDFNRETSALERKRLNLVSFTRYINTSIPLVEEILKHRPNYRIHFDVHNNRDFSLLKLHHPFDFGIGCVLQSTIAPMKSAFLGQSPLVLCVPKRHYLANYRKVTPEALAKEKLIVLPSSTLIGGVVQRNYRFLDPSNFVMETSNTPVALELVARGYGSHITDLLATSDRDSEDYTILKISPEVNLDISAFWPESTILAPDEIELFCSIVREAIERRLKRFEAASR